MKTQQWSALKKGDTVDIIAPGMKPLPGTVKGVKKFLNTWGLKARYSKKLTGKDLVCANSKENRLDDLKRALLAKDSQMVWCLRGGYGSLHLLDELSKIRAPKPKIFMGLSDITSLHTFLNQKWSWSTIHGTNLYRLSEGLVSKAEENRFRKLLFGETTTCRYSLKPLNEPAQKNKQLRSSVLGGNMVTLQSSFGTRFEMKTHGRILFFEDVGERAYRIDRILEHMNQLNLLKKVKAIVFGQFTGGREPNGKSLVPNLLRQFAREQSFPVFSGLQSGHGKNQHPLPFNTSATIQCGLKPTIAIESGVGN